jgi:hypothetical protein
VLGEPACRQLGIYPIPSGFMLSEVIPAYNEERWISEVIKRVDAVPIPKTRSAPFSPSCGSGILIGAVYQWTKQSEPGNRL